MTAPGQMWPEAILLPPSLHRHTDTHTIVTGRIAKKHRLKKKEIITFSPGRLRSHPHENAAQTAASLKIKTTRQNSQHEQITTKYIECTSAWL